MKLVLLAAGVLLLVVVLALRLKTKSAPSSLPTQSVPAETRNPAESSLDRAPVGRMPVAPPSTTKFEPTPDASLAPDGHPWSKTQVIYPGEEPYTVRWTGQTKRIYFPSGELYAEMTYANGKQDGESRSWYRNGQFWSQDQWVAGEREGPSTALSDKGVLLARGAYKSGFSDGAWETWFPDGSPQSVGTYESSPTEHTKLKVGHWTIWKAPGIIDEKESGTYVHGVLVGH